MWVQSGTEKWAVGLLWFLMEVTRKLVDLGAENEK